MGSPFQPRKLVSRQRSFGRSLTLEWIDPHTDTEELQLRAAKIQNEWAYTMHGYREAQGMTIDTLARHLGMNTQRLGDILRGDSPINLIDLATAEHLTGARPTWLPTPSAPSDTDPVQRPTP